MWILQLWGVMFYKQQWGQVADNNVEFFSVFADFLSCSINCWKSCVKISIWLWNYCLFLPLSQFLFHALSDSVLVNKHLWLLCLPAKLLSIWNIPLPDTNFFCWNLFYLISIKPFQPSDYYFLDISFSIYFQPTSIFLFEVSLVEKL